MKVTLSLLTSFMLYFNQIPVKEVRLSLPYNFIFLSAKAFHWNMVFPVNEFKSEDKEKFLDFLKKSPDVSDFTDIYSAQFEEYIKNSRYRFFICRSLDSSDIIGFLLIDSIQFGYEQQLYIRALGVDFEYRRFGIASKLLEHVQDFAKQNNYKSLSIYASNESAKKCYQKFGFMQNTDIKKRSKKQCKCCLDKWLYKTIN